VKKIKIRPSDELLLLWVYKKAKRGFMPKSAYEIPFGYYGLKVPKDDEGSTIYPGNTGKVSRKSALYIVRVSPFKALGWGIGSLSCLTLEGIEATAGAHGTFSFVVELPQLLYERTSDMGDKVSLESLRERILPEISGIIISTFDSSTIKRTDAIAKVIGECEHKIAEVFSSFGLKLESFVIEGTG